MKIRELDVERRFEVSASLLELELIIDGLDVVRSRYEGVNYESVHAIDEMRMAISMITNPPKSEDGAKENA